MTLRASLLLVVLTLSVPALPGDAQGVDQQAADLVRALRFQPIFEAATRYAFLHNEQVRALPAPVRNCIATLDLSFAHDMYVAAIREVLTPAEIGEALRYYQSRAGYLNTMVSIRRNRARLEGKALLEEADGAGEPSKAEWRLMEEFARSPLARKMGQLDTEVRKETLSDIAADRMLSQCRPQP